MSGQIIGRDLDTPLRLLKGVLRLIRGEPRRIGRRSELTVLILRHR